MGSQSWRTFLSNQLRGIWAADLLAVQDRELPDSLRLVLCDPRAAGARPLQRHRQSERSLDMAPTPGGDSLGPTAELTHPRPRFRFMAVTSPRLRLRKLPCQFGCGQRRICAGHSRARGERTIKRYWVVDPVGGNN